MPPLLRDHTTARHGSDDKPHHCTDASLTGRSARRQSGTAALAAQAKPRASHRWPHSEPTQVPDAPTPHPTADLRHPAPPLPAARQESLSAS